MTDKKKELTENEKRVEGSLASEGAHVTELQVDEKDRQAHVAGDIKETKPAKDADKK